MSKLALVTGATSGIGAAFAERLAADGHDLVVVGRRRDRLEQFAAAHTATLVRAVAADLSTDDGIDTVARICAEEPLDLLVNNAGVAHYMPLAELPADKARELVKVKVLAPTLLARAAVAGMQERGRGAIVNVAGMIAFSGPAPHSQLPRRACTPVRSPTWSRCPRPSAPNSKAPACRSRSCARGWSRPSSTSAKDWT
ncbi:SDR family oxidoreductase [Amycolatopsis sp. FDAARGOS 1241]|uniref:SDR family NAD(P)-dependent oxidoreductase n=1 Tax=Amycolatopsis sp. FDAARGOS 1241 TaxID=2778070 RepID=UPI001EF33B9B|nr:SDR family NAD(P)-dependent oxidoreductase [Amycolatopsis sp. FDAARGOS 1241]